MLLRRHVLRLLRIRNLLALTIIIIILYLLKTLNKLKEQANVIVVQEEEQNKLELKAEHFTPSSLKKIDWHNYEQIQYDKIRVGVGEQGKPAVLSAKEQEIEARLYSENGFNGALSDKISLNRSLPDIRHPGCRKRKYIESLPTVSVVVPFHNEHWSTLLRTANSVLYRSPKHLIKEIFLVDDASTKEFLKKKLEVYLAEYMPKVKVVRLLKRSGLITARLAGAKLSTGDVIIFLDSHTEANVNWLPPLLEPIALNYRTVVCPFIDVVAYDTFEYRAQDEGARGAFDWEFFYKRLPILPKDEKNMPEPFESPVMAGGLFAISRKYFWELGGYDPGLDIWGGEQYELSFKIWQCGGRMVDAPCSRVGHIYRKFAPFPNPHHGDFVAKNYRRVADVWMDEYAEHLYARRPHYRDVDAGDLTEQKALRKRLNCRSFRWFITQIAFDLPFKYPPVEPPPFGEGRIRPSSDLKLCADAHGGEQTDKLLLNPCDDSDEQHYVLSWHKDIKLKRNMCWDLPDSAPRSPILLYHCHLGGGNQLWRYHMDTQEIRHGFHDDNHCLDWDVSTHELFISRCRSGSETQKWTVDTIVISQMAQWDKAAQSVTGPVEEYNSGD